MKCPEVLTPPARSSTAPNSSNPSPPNELDSVNYRKALSCFATGVTVVTARWQNTDWGMTCNSFASVSLDPRLVLWSIRKQASSLPAFTQSGGFTVSVLAAHQQDLARQFATGPMHERFAGVGTRRIDGQRVHLTEAVAWFDCTLANQVEAGDHCILIGQVHQCAWQEGAALSYWRSQFGQFQAL